MKYLLFLWCITCSLSFATIPTKNQPLSSYEEELFTWSRTFAELMHAVGQKYYVPVAAKKSMLEAMNAFLNFDPHSHVLSPEKYEALLQTTRAEISGIGVLLAPKETADDLIVIEDVIPGGPADKAGIVMHDKIAAIDGSVISRLTNDEITDMLRGKPGSSVSITILRPGDSIATHTLKRETIQEEEVTGYRFDDFGIWYLHITTFSENCAEKIKKIALEALPAKPQGIILDLRRNAGGLMQAAVDCAGLFITAKSPVVCIKDRHGKVLESYTTTTEPLTWGTIPIVCLIDQHTASAAEILAGVLSEQKNIFFFTAGTTTFGKGSVQEVIPLSNNCAAKLTTALYYLPSDKTVQGSGLTPDFIIQAKQKMESPLSTREQSLARSIKPGSLPGQQKNALREKKDWKARKMERLASDNQLHYALHLISTITLARECCPTLVTTPADARAFLKKRVVSNDTFSIKNL